MLYMYKKLMKQTTIVTRNGEKYKIGSEKLVIGDLIDLTQGDIVPTDVRIVKAFSLKVN